MAEPIRSIRPCIGLALVVFAVPLVVPTVDSATFQVDSTQDGEDADAGDGVCATRGGVCSLRAAVTEANQTAEPDTVLVPAGRYLLSLEAVAMDPRQVGLDVRSPLTVLGAGPEATRIESPPEGEDGFFVSLGHDLHVEGLALIARGDGQTGRFGRTGIFVGDATGTVRDCLITGFGPGAAKGVGIWGEGARLTVEDCVIEDNVAFLGIDQDGGELTVRRTTIRRSEGTTDSGGILAQRVTRPVLVEDCLISDLCNVERSSRSIPGIDVRESVLIVRRTTLARNCGFSAGGILIERGELLLENSTLAGNRGLLNAGALHVSVGATAEVINSTLSGNRSPGRGAAIRMTAADGLRVLSSTFFDNSSSFGASLEIDPLTTTLTHCVLIGGGEVCSEVPTTTGWNMLDADAADSCGSDGPGDFQVPPGGSGLRPLHAYGGPTFTHALDPLSPAIDAGGVMPCQDLAGGMLAGDQRGFARPTDGDDDGQSPCDIGATEWVVLTEGLSLADNLHPREDIKESLNSCLRSWRVCPVELRAGPLGEFRLLGEGIPRGKDHIMVFEHSESTEALRVRRAGAALVISRG